MKYLQSIRLVQFFLFEKQDIRLGEITGIFGPNGSGKSSLLDAVQIAMMGGNTRLISLNAQADEQTTTRSLRAYCLGQYGEIPEHRARDNAVTYITLIWRDSKTNEPISMGVCVHAAGDREGHEVLGRYVIRGVELVMSDHLEIVDGQERPREWSTFRHSLIERAKMAGLEDVLFTDSQRYIRAVLLALKGSGDLASAEAFTRAFRFALRMRFDKAVDQIVRNDVLESRPTNIHKFKEVTDSFRRLTEMVRQLEVKIGDSERVAGDFGKATEESRKTATWNALLISQKYRQHSDA
jgi:energy-coupling factor transporter ATP-binding protein EcfA2